MSSNELVIKIIIVRSEAIRLPMLLYTGGPILFGMPVFYEHELKYYTSLWVVQNII